MKIVIYQHMSFNQDVKRPIFFHWDAGCLFCKYNNGPFFAKSTKKGDLNLVFSRESLLSYQQDISSARF